MYKPLNKSDILNDLKSIIPDNIIKVDEPLKRYTYLKLAERQISIYPQQNEEVQAIVALIIIIFLLHI